MRSALPCVLLLLAPACRPSDGDTAATVDLRVTAVDPTTGEPVPDAWLALDLGDALFSARTGGDGSATLPGLPADARMDLTLAAVDRYALTMTAIPLDETEPDWTLGLGLIDESLYDSRTITVSGTIQGAPEGSWVMLYGARDYHDYVQGAGDTPVPFAFQATLVGDEDSYTFSAVALDNDYVVQGIAVASAAEDDPSDLALVIEPEALTTLAMDIEPPTILGQPAALPPSDWCIQVLSTGLVDARGVVTGWNEACEQNGAGFRFTAAHLPLTEAQAATVYLADDYADPLAYSWAEVGLEPGAETASVAMLDTPVLDENLRLEPGATIRWTAPEGMRSQMLYVMQGDDLAWLLYPGEDTLTYPRLPDDFDRSLLPASGTWSLSARDFATDEDGVFSLDEPYRVAVVTGGEVAR